ncbi:MAG: signal peptide peptidase SppA, partial [Rhizobiales bacterium]|nr:signal peptide peptidase SppA [Hyphomicrobiales bacterium]
SVRVRDWQLRSRFSDFSFLHLAAVHVLDAVGLSTLARQIENSAVLRSIEGLNLDGLLALWHPQSSN